MLQLVIIFGFGLAVGLGKWWFAIIFLMAFFAYTLPR